MLDEERAGDTSQGEERLHLCRVAAMMGWLNDHWVMFSYVCLNPLFCSRSRWNVSRDDDDRARTTN